MARGSLCLLAVLAAFFVGVCLGQNVCFEQLQQQMQCVQQKLCQQGQSAGASPRQQAADKCYTDNGCTPPDHSKPHGCEGHRKGARGQGKGKAHQHGGPDDCMKAVFNRTGELFKQCLQQKGVQNLPKGGGHHGPHHAGPSNPPPQYVAKHCNGDAQKAQKVSDCLAALPKPTKEEAKVKYDAVCAAEQQCNETNSVSSDCQAQLQSLGKAMCECKQQVKPQFKQALAEECPNKKPPQEPEQQPDCNKQHKTRCEQGFDAFYEHLQGPPPPQPQ